MGGGRKGERGKGKEKDRQGKDERGRTGGEGGLFTKVLAAYFHWCSSVSISAFISTNGSTILSREITLD